MYYLQREQPIKKALKEILKKLWSAELESESELEDKSKKRQTITNAISENQNQNQNQNQDSSKFGIITYPSGEKYEGESKDSLRHGLGKIIDQKIYSFYSYEGEVKDDKMSGRGTEVDAHNCCGGCAQTFLTLGKPIGQYEVDFKDDKNFCEITKTYAFITRYDGEFQGSKNMV